MYAHLGVTCNMHFEQNDRVVVWGLLHATAVKAGLGLMPKYGVSLDRSIPSAYRLCCFAVTLLVHAFEIDLSGP